MLRHNEVIRSIHLALSLKYNLKKNKRLKTHSVSKYITSDKVEIRVDTTITTDIKIKHNKPNIIVWDKYAKEITIIKVGITNQEKLQETELKKMRKYDLLAKELGQIYDAKTFIIPIVLTWDGIVTKFHDIYMKRLGLNNTTITYYQMMVIKRTLESISIDFRRVTSLGDESRSNLIEQKVNGIQEMASKIEQVFFN